MCNPFRLKFIKMDRFDWNALKFKPRWNKGVPIFGFIIGTKYFGHFSQNGTKFITLIYIIYIRRTKQEKEKVM